MQSRRDRFKHFAGKVMGVPSEVCSAGMEGVHCELFAHCRCAQLERWKQHRVPQRYDLPSPFAVNDLHTPEPIRTFIDRDAPGTANEMVNSFHDDFQQIVFRVIGDAEQRQPFRSDLVAERKAGNLDVGAFADY